MLPPLSGWRSTVTDNSLPGTGPNFSPVASQVDIWFPYSEKYFMQSGVGDVGKCDECGIYHAGLNPLHIRAAEHAKLNSEPSGFWWQQPHQFPLPRYPRSSGILSGRTPLPKEFPS